MDDSESSHDALAVQVAKVMIVVSHVVPENGAAKIGAAEIGFVEYRLCLGAAAPVHFLTTKGLLMKLTRSFPTLWLCSVFLTLAVVGCQGEPAVTDSAKTPASGSEVSVLGVSIVAGELPTDQQQQAMLKAKDALFQKLSGRLMEAMGTEGPAAAIAVCHKEAFDLAKEVGDSEGLKIGRTGVRLRNSKNQPPEWAKQFVDDRIDTPTFVQLTNGHSAALLPIKLQSQCLMCHGAKDQIAPVIQEQLAVLYPDDQAVGFAEGELRGWFWIEKP